MHIKDVNVTNEKNVLVQIPGFIARKWGLVQGDNVEVHITDDEQAVIIRPKKIQARSHLDKKGERVVRGAAGRLWVQSV